jgi:two-component system sensor histidine kinase PilS (NtrC family)
MLQSARPLVPLNAGGSHGIHALIFGRLALLFLLLLGSWWWFGGYLPQPAGPFQTSLFLFFLVSVTLTGIYYAASLFKKHPQEQKIVQVFVDVLLISWLVCATDGINSPYISLYIVLICLSGFMLGKTATLTITFLSAACFLLLAILTGQSVIFSIAGDVPVSRTFQTVGFNLVAILFVGLIAARIAERKQIGEELKRSKESFADLNDLHERIVESIETGLITTDLDGTIYSINAAAEKILNERQHEIVGSNITDLCSKELTSIVDRSLAEARSGTLKSEHFEKCLNCAGGSEVNVRGSVSPLFRRNGQIAGLMITLLDVSEVRNLEASLRRADRLAAVGRMAAGLAHEIRNPLGSLSSSLQFLRQRVPTNSSERSLFDVVLRESERLNKIIEDFLSYARPPADALEPRRTTDIDAALRDCLTLLRHSPKVTDAHQFKYDPPANPIRSRMSETHVKQVMWNLLQNSINAMPDGGDITVRVKENSGRVQMHFEDTGPGFSAASLEHLYEPFSVAAGGTGLGLSIVHKIINDNGGRIEIGNSDSSGTLITVELPR